MRGLNCKVDVLGKFGGTVRVHLRQQPILHHTRQPGIMCESEYAARHPNSCVTVCHTMKCIM